MFKQKITPLNSHKGAVYTSYVFNDNFSHISNAINGLISNDRIPWTTKLAKYNYTSNYMSVPALFFTTKRQFSSIWI